MADKTIGSLDRLETLDREAKFAVESGGKSYYGEVGQLEDNATAAAKAYADQAKTDADRAAEKAKDAEDVAIHPPILKDGSDNWWTWSVEANDYVESDKDAGVSLDISPETITGEPGSDAKVENLGTKTDPVLQFTLPRGEKGVSPTVKVSKVDKTTTITITDEAGEHVATVLDGEDGAGQVTSVNGKTGEVSITAEDVGAYTKNETDTKVAAATSRTWEVTVQPTAWVASTETWAGYTAAWSAEVQAEGVTAETCIKLVNYISGDRPSYDAVAWLNTGDGTITLYAPTKPTAAFMAAFTEVR